MTDTLTGLVSKRLLTVTGVGLSACIGKLTDHQLDVFAGLAGLAILCFTIEQICQRVWPVKVAVP